MRETSEQRDQRESDWFVESATSFSTKSNFVSSASFQGYGCKLTMISLMSMFWFIQVKEKNQLEDALVFLPVMTDSTVPLCFSD
ncbi:hypothetical protein YC2023_118905 [Brassica napus]